MNRDYLNAKIDLAKRLDILFEQMTLEERVGQLIQFDARTDGKKWVQEHLAGSALHVRGEEAKKLQEFAFSTRTGIPLLFGIDAIHGHCFNPECTVFPTQLALASSFDPELLQRIAEATARSVVADNLHMTFSPVFCLGRDPRWGRIDETFGEDPFLAGELGAAMVRGYQGDTLSSEQAVIACAKHFIAYGETLGGRDSTEADLSHEAMRELFLPPFERGIEAGCAAVMAAYNAVNGVPCSASSNLLKAVLREEMGFSGIVITDWNNVGSLVDKQRLSSSIEEATSLALAAGNDLIMNTPEALHAAVNGVRNGDIDEETVNSSCRRVLQLKFECGLFDGRAIPSVQLTETDKAEDKLLAKQAALSSIVLLKNRMSSLPLSADEEKILVTGPNADSIFNELGDWSFGPRDPGWIEWNGSHANAVTPLAGIRNYLSNGKKGEIAFTPGCSLDGADDDFEEIEKACTLAEESSSVVLVIGDGFNQNGEGRDRADLHLSGEQSLLLKKLREHTKNLVVVLVMGKPLSIPEVEEYADAILLLWNPGEEGGTALAELLFGETSPSGKLPISIPYTTGQIPVYYNQKPGWHGGKYWDAPAEPLYPFAYGLSYTSFVLSSIKLGQAVVTEQDGLHVSYSVKNTGDCTGAEVVQIYLHRECGGRTCVEKTLIFFDRLTLEPDECSKRTVDLSASELKKRAPGLTSPLVGRYRLYIGTSSRDEDCTVLPFEFV